MTIGIRVRKPRECADNHRQVHASGGLANRDGKP